MAVDVVVVDKFQICYVDAKSSLHVRLCVREDRLYVDGTKFCSDRDCKF